MEGRAQTQLNRMPDTIVDQASFGRLTRDLLAAFDLADQRDETGDEGRGGVRTAKLSLPPPTARPRIQRTARAPNPLPTPS